MKEVYVLRHANWNGKEDALTQQGKDAAKDTSISLPEFTSVFSSPLTRAQQTAVILGREMTPKVDTAASVPQSPAEVRDQILARRVTHPLGIAGALFETKEAHPSLKLAGAALVQLIQKTFKGLQEDQKALIVSHDGTMVAAERMLTSTEFTDPLTHTYDELEGFVVNEDLSINRYIL